MMPAAQIGGDRRAPELGSRQLDLRRRQPEIEIDAGKVVERDRHCAPFTVVAGEQADSRDVRRDIDRLGGQRALHGLPSIRGKGEHAFGRVAVELDIDGR
jgi:hypothetical protein